MLYKPKFCCQCGEKIERVSWNLVTSRRFCELCETEFTVNEWMPKIGLGIGLLFGIFFIGSFFQNSDKLENGSSTKLLKSSQQLNSLPDQKSVKQLAELPGNKAQDKNLVATPSVQIQTNSQSADSSQGLDQRKQAELFQKQQNDKKEVVYYCGAETKKGTPCSRRMKGGGRCWQHQGKKAMLPESQLTASQ
jgi:hypothetical protein